MYRNVWWLMALLVGCPAEEPETEPVCVPGTDVEFRVSRAARSRGCTTEDYVPGTCDSLAYYLEHTDEEPPRGECWAQGVFSFTELATGDCLAVHNICPGMLEGDERYGDCSLSEVADCCAWADNFWPYGSCPARP